MNIDLDAYQQVRQYVATLYGHSDEWGEVADRIIAAILNCNPGSNHVMYVPIPLPPLRAELATEARLTVAPEATLTLVKHDAFDLWTVDNGTMPTRR